jgi:hypothetical protein
MATGIIMKIKRGDIISEPHPTPTNSGPSESYGPCFNTANKSANMTMGPMIEATTFRMTWTTTNLLQSTAETLSA